MRILLAEDEKSLSNALVSIFKHNNYSIDAVYNGIEAIEYAKNGVYDVIILDVMMPVLDGISALKEIRNLNIATPVLMLTAKTEIEELIGFEKEGYELMSMISLGVAEDDTPNQPPRKPLEEVVTFID